MRKALAVAVLGAGLFATGLGAGTANAVVSPVFGADPKLDKNFEATACRLLDFNPTPSQMNSILNQDVEMGLSLDYITDYLQAAKNVCPQHKGLLNQAIEVTK